MARLRPFSYIVLKHPLPDNEQTEDTTVLLQSEKPILAKNQEVVTMKVSRLLPEEEIENLDRIEFFVSPF